jgi:predicted amidophosphoribosyltransferase
MHLVFSKLIDQLRLNSVAPVCIRCGSYFPRKMFCCIGCAQELLSTFSNFQCEVESKNKVSVSSLIDWKPNTSDSLSLVIHLLKHGSAKPVWKFMATEFSGKINLDQINESNSVLVPIPGHQAGSTHTHYFSEFLSQILGLRKVDLIRPTPQPRMISGMTEQKKLTKRQRLMRDRHFCVDFTTLNDLKNIKNLILIDDIITTGATIGFCANLIKSETDIFSHSQLHAWVLFRRIDTSLQQGTQKPFKLL